MKVVLSSNTSWYLFNFRSSTIRRLIDEGHKVVCLSPDDPYSKRLESELGAEHRSLGLEGKSTSLVAELRSLIHTWRVLWQEAPDMVFNFTVKMNVYCGLVCAIRSIPFANNVSGLGTAFLHESWLFRRVRQLYGFVNRRARHLFFQNEEDLAEFRRRGLLGDTAHTLLPGSGVDLSRFRLEPMPEEKPTTFILIGRLLGDKGVREYARASEILLKRGVDVRCLLLGPQGTSNRTAILKDEVAGWEASGAIEYLGQVDDVRPMISESHVLVLPSYREGMPRTVLEAAAMGRPAIVSDVPGCRHAIVENVTGWLCEVRSAESLARVMIRVANLRSQDLRSAGLDARAHVERHFGESVVVDAYMACLQQSEDRRAQQ